MAHARPYRHWFCRKCVGEEGSCDLQAGETKPGYPALGWRMQKGRFMQPQWEAALVEDAHRDMAKRAIGGEPAPGEVNGWYAL